MSGREHLHYESARDAASRRGGWVVVILLLACGVGGAAYLLTNRAPSGRSIEERLQRLERCCPVAVQP